MKKYQPVILYFCAGDFARKLPVGELRYPIYLLSKRWPVLLVEPPLTLRERLRRGHRMEVFKRSRSLRRFPDTKMAIFTPRVPLPYSIRLPLPCSLKKQLLKWNVREISHQAMWAFRRLWPGKALPDIVWGTIFHHADFFHQVRGKHNLAIIDDNFPVSPVFSCRQKKRVARMEKKLIRRSEYIFTTSRTLFEEKRKINPNTVMMENGVSRLFLPENRSELDVVIRQSSTSEQRILGKIKSLPRPRLGYVGAVNIRLWRPIIEQIPNLPPAVQTCFVGNIDDSFPKDLLGALKSCPQVHFFPYMSHAMIPLLMEEFDLLLLPFQKTRFSHYINPLKLSEYLTSGKPILSTSLTEVVRICSQKQGLVDFIGDPGDFPGLVEQALIQDRPEMRNARIQMARQRTWEKTTAEMMSIVEGLLEGGTTPQNS